MMSVHLSTLFYGIMLTLYMNLINQILCSLDFFNTSGTKKIFHFLQVNITDSREDKIISSLTAIQGTILAAAILMTHLFMQANDSDPAMLVKDVTGFYPCQHATSWHFVLIYVIEHNCSIKWDYSVTRIVALA